MVLKNNVGQNFIYCCSNGTLEQRGGKLYLPLFKWYLTWGKTFFTTFKWGKTLFTAVQMVLKKHVGQNFIYRCSNGTLEQRGAKLYLLLFKWYLRTTWAKLYLPLFKWYLRTLRSNGWGKTLFTADQMVLRTTWGKTLFTAVQMVVKNNVGQNFIYRCSNGT